MNSDHASTQFPLVDCAWLETHGQDKNVRIIDASWHLPGAQRDARAEYNEAHIPGAIFFDIDQHSAASELPHMLPDAEHFSSIAGSLGISEQHTIVVYDTVGLFSAARVWWMFRHFGARRAFVLDGGLPAWVRNGGQVKDNTQQLATSPVGERIATCQFNIESSVQERHDELADITDVKNAMNDKHCMIMDARASGRFKGTAPEVRPGLRSGHIPGSVNLPFTHVLDDQGRLKSVAELEKLFTDLGVSGDTRVITSCGSGVTAAVLCLALTCVGFDDVALYDGSWTEWGACEDTPVAAAT